MECRDAQFYLRMRRHAADELGPDVTAPLDAHLATCPACAADARELMSFDRAVASTMVNVPIPSGLRARLIASGAEKQGTALRRKAYRAVAALAASLLFAGLALGVFTNTRPKPNNDELVALNDRLLSDPQQSTKEWLAAQKLPNELPLPFDYTLLVSLGYEKVNGRDVPVIVFRSPHPDPANLGEPAGFAKVYLFPHDGRFDLKNLQESQASLTRAQVYVGRDAYRGVTYVFVHTGRDLQKFFRTGNVGAIHI